MSSLKMSGGAMSLKKPGRLLPGFAVALGLVLFAHATPAFAAPYGLECDGDDGKPVWFLRMDADAQSLRLSTDRVDAMDPKAPEQVYTELDNGLITFLSLSAFTFDRSSTTLTEDGPSPTTYQCKALGK